MATTPLPSTLDCSWKMQLNCPSTDDAHVNRQPSATDSTAPDRSVTPLDTCTDAEPTKSMVPEFTSATSTVNGRSLESLTNCRSPSTAFAMLPAAVLDGVPIRVDSVDGDWAAPNTDDCGWEVTMREPLFKIVRGYPTT